MISESQFMHTPSNGLLCEDLNQKPISLNSKLLYSPQVPGWASLLTTSSWMSFFTHHEFLDELLYSPWVPGWASLLTTSSWMSFFTHHEFLAELLYSPRVPGWASLLTTSSWMSFFTHHEFLDELLYSPQVPEWAPWHCGWSVEVGLTERPASVGWRGSSYISSPTRGFPG